LKEEEKMMREDEEREKRKEGYLFILIFFANFKRTGETKKLFLTDDKPSGTGRSFQK
jgi:hypothetical protein